MMMKRWIARYANGGLAASGKAAAALWGPRWQSDPRRRVLYCGVDLKPFHTPADRSAVRAELGIPPEAFVVGHVGAFMEQKNHRFLIDIASNIAERDTNTRFLLIGDGPLRHEMEHRVAEAGLAGRFIFAGVRPDVPRLMLGAMDALLFPSLHEGLGLVLIEAQAAGLPCILSDVVPEEADVVPFLIHRHSLAESPSVWGDTVLRLRGGVPPLLRQEALAAVTRSPFDVHASARELESFYRESERVRFTA